MLDLSERTRAIEKALSELGDKLYGLDDQEREIREVFRRWYDTRKGDACILTGAKSSGRSTLVNKIVEEYISQKGIEQCNQLYIAQLGTDQVAHAALDGDKNDRRIIVLEDADELVLRPSQTLLYKMLGTARDTAWLVLLMVDTADFVTRLEKRVRSRIPLTKVTFVAPPTVTEYREALRAFLTPTSKKKEKINDWQKFVNSFLDQADFKMSLIRLYEESNSLSALKQCAALFLQYLAICNEELSPISIWRDVIESMFPLKSPLAAQLMKVPLRTFCVFLCVLRRVGTLHLTSVSYSKVLVDYKHLCNTSDSRMHVSTDEIVFKELDRLVELGVITSTHSTTHTSYKRVSLNGSYLTYTDLVASRSIPSNIRDWYKSHVTN